MKPVLFLLAAIVSSGAYAQEKPASPHDTVDTKEVKVTYGRPYKKGRVVFGELEKFGKVWRTGANQATTITFKEDGKFGGKDVKAGTYTLFTIPNEKEWTVILNSEPNQWGAYKYNKDKDVLSVNVPVKKLSNVVEQFTIRFKDDDELIMEWDQTQVVVPIDF
jgi:hypothetical protein